MYAQKLNKAIVLLLQLSQKWSILIILPMLYFQAGVDPVLCNVPTIERVGGGGIRLAFATSASLNLEGILHTKTYSVSNLKFYLPFF